MRFMQWAAVSSRPPSYHVTYLFLSFPSRDVLVSLFLLQCTGYEPIDLSNVNATKLVYVIVDDKPHIMNVATGVR